jgi:hypothetical protein
VLVFIQRSTTNQIQLLFNDQSALTALTTDATCLGSAPPRFVQKTQLPASNPRWRNRKTLFIRDR